MELTNMKGLIVVISSFFLFYIDIWELLSYHYSEFYSPYIQFLPKNGYKCCFFPSVDSY